MTQTQSATVTWTTVRGIEALPAEVDVTLSSGLPYVEILGLAEGAVREARVRVRSAIVNSGFAFHQGRVAVNVAPTTARKEGTGFDLPIAVAMLVAAGAAPPARMAGTFILGELSLDGSVRPVRGALLSAEAAKKAGCRVVVVALENGAEAAIVDGIEVRTVRHLRDVVAWLDGADAAAPLAVRQAEAHEAASFAPDLSDIRGQPFARRALEIAAAGAHHMLLVGGPGAGKTMLARRLPGILPALTDAEAVAVTRVASVAGLNIGGGLVRRRPFRAPHHSTTAAGLVGGGAPLARPGEISLAHNGVLFLDELPEFQRQTLEMLQEPLRWREVTLMRSSGTVAYPAAAIVVASMNPCPCGQLGQPRLRCRCSVADVTYFHARLKTSLMSSFDLSVEVPPVDLSAFEGVGPGESSASVRARVTTARAIQMVRQGMPNGHLDSTELAAHVILEEGAKSLLARAQDRLQVAGVAVLRVARTIADLAGAAVVDESHVAEALQLRSRPPVAKEVERKTA